jgi:hypothetical protein
MEKINGWICQRCNEKISNETHIITHIEDKSHWRNLPSMHTLQKNIPSQEILWTVIFLGVLSPYFITYSKCCFKEWSEIISSFEHDQKAIISRYNISIPFFQNGIEARLISYQWITMVSCCQGAALVATPSPSGGSAPWQHGRASPGAWGAPRRAGAWQQAPARRTPAGHVNGGAVRGPGYGEAGMATAGHGEERGRAEDGGAVRYPPGYRRITM